jgi:flagellar basal-body rod protein FlgB
MFLKGKTIRKVAAQSLGSKSFLRYDCLVARDHTFVQLSPLRYDSYFQGGFIMALKMGHTLTVMERYLDGATARQKAIANNISNVNTPGFKRYLVSFEDKLHNAQENPKKQVLKMTQPEHIGFIKDETYDVTRDRSAGNRADGNNVDLEQEMTLMIKSNLYYNGAIKQINKKIAMQKYIYSDGKG